MHITTIDAPTGSPLTISTVFGLDHLAQFVARALAQVSRVSGAGVFWVAGGSSFWDAWRESGKLGGGSITIRLGRLELIADYRAASLSA
jgi:hypothetical protein